MTRNPPTTGSSEIRGLRLRTQLSQSGFANVLGVSVETYRTWDSGRRTVPAAWLDRAREVAAANNAQRLWSLQDLATTLGVHVRTLRDAARSGRLEVRYVNRVVFRNPVPRATMAAGLAFLERYYRQSYSRSASRPRPPEQTCVPPDCARSLLCVRRELRLTQAQLAKQIGAAGKAVVYQWESRHLLVEDGSTPWTERDVPANSRSTFWMGGTAVTDDSPFGGLVAGKKFGALVESLSTPSGTAAIVVERAMYSNANGVVWAAGTDVVATKLK